MWSPGEVRLKRSKPIIFRAERLDLRLTGPDFGTNLGLSGGVSDRVSVMLNSLGLKIVGNMFTKYPRSICGRGGQSR